MPINIQIASTAKDVLAKEALCVGIFDRLLHDDRQVAILAANVDVSGIGAHREGCNHHTFDHRMGIVLENQAVFTGSGLTFVAVAQNILGLGGLFGNK